MNTKCEMRKKKLFPYWISLIKQKQHAKMDIFDLKREILYPFNDVAASAVESA